MGATMQTSVPKPADDEALDPAVERLRVKLSRLMLVSVGTLLIGVLAVLVAVIYRSTRDEAPAPSGTVQRDVELVPGAVLRSATLAANGLLVEIERADGGVDVVVFDRTTGAATLQLRFAEPAADR